MTSLRFPVALGGALLVTLLLFWTMQRLILAGHHEPPVAQPVTLLERIRVTEEPPPPPPPPLTVETAPEPVTSRPLPATLSIAPLTLPAAPVSLPQFDLPVSIAGRLQASGVLTGVAGGNALADFTRGQTGFDGADLVPISSARPRYPRSAATRQIEGWVEVIFVITGEGRVNDVRVLDASPRGVFEDAAVHAMRRWLYPPFYVDDKPVAREATQLFRFQLDDIQQLYLWDD